MVRVGPGWVGAASSGWCGGRRQPWRAALQPAAAKAGRLHSASAPCRPRSGRRTSGAPEALRRTNLEAWQSAHLVLACQVQHRLHHSVQVDALGCPDVAALRKQARHVVREGAWVGAALVDRPAQQVRGRAVAVACVRCVRALGRPASGVGVEKGAPEDAQERGRRGSSSWTAAGERYSPSRARVGGQALRQLPLSAPPCPAPGSRWPRAAGASGGQPPRPTHLGQSC